MNMNAMLAKGINTYDLPLEVEIAAYVIICVLLILGIKSMIKNMRYRTFIMEGRVGQKMDTEDDRGRITYEISLVRENGDTQRYQTDKKTYESVKVGDRIRAAVRRDRIVRVDWL